MNASSHAHRRIDLSAADLLPPQARRAARPPHGAPHPVAHRRADVVDAVFETVPGLARGQAASSFPKRHAAAPASPKASGPLIAAERMLKRIPARAFAALTLTLCLLAFLAGGRLSAPSAVAALRLEQVETRLSDVDGMRVVSVYGSVVNGSAMARAVPPIQVDLLGPAGRVRVDGQLAGAGPLAPGAHRRFTARLPHAGGSLPAVEISFAPTGAPPR